MEDSRLAFRISMWRPWLLAVIPLGVLAVVGIALSIARSSFAPALAIAIGFAILAAILLLVIGMSIRASQWHVDPNGIGGRNNALAYRRLNWSEIESIEPWLIPGYPYVQINGGGKRRVFWVPLFLTDMPGFRAAIARYAPPDNPLRRYLEAH